MAGEQGERGPYGQLTRLFLTQLLAVIAIAAVITVVVALSGGGLDDDVSTSPPSRTPSATATPEASDATATSPPPTSPSAAPTTTATATATPLATASTPVDRPAKVDVLNQSAGDGAAGLLADQLRATGWRIGRVDDFSGNVSETTVYWIRRGDRRDARRLAEELGGVRVQEGFSTLKQRRLSVVLVDPAALEGDEDD